MDKDKNPVPSPYALDFSNFKSSFEDFDSFPPTVTWIKSIGASFGKRFNVTVLTESESWSIDHDKKTLNVGSIENMFTRRGVLGLILNGIGRIALSIKMPDTSDEAIAFAAAHNVDTDVAKHFGALTKTIDEIRTDDEMAKAYAGSKRIVDTMHAQAHESAGIALRMMAADMFVRRKKAQDALMWLNELVRFAEHMASKDTSKDATANEAERARELITPYLTGSFNASFQMMLPQIQSMFPANDIQNIAMDNRKLTVLMLALHPERVNEIMTGFARAYRRNVTAYNDVLLYVGTDKKTEETLIQAASLIAKEMDELKLFASHHGGHAQYVMAKAEQMYHSITLGFGVESPFFDIEAKKLGVEHANDVALQIANIMRKRGVTSSVEESIAFAKELLPILAEFPYLDLNDGSKNEEGKESNMQKRVSGNVEKAPKQKRTKEREKKSEAQRANDRRKLDSIDNKKNQEEVDKARTGHSILDTNRIDPLKAYAYIIGPYLDRIATTAGKLRRILKVNDPTGMRGAYRRGKKLNTRILYKHRLDDFRLFSRKEQEKTNSYGFAVMADLSGSTENRSAATTNRMIQDEILAATFLIAEVVERIGDKVMCSLGYFSSGAETVKRPGYYLNRATLIPSITEHGGGTNVEDTGSILEEDLREMEDFKIKHKTIVFVTDGAFYAPEFQKVVEAAKQYNASIAYFQISSGIDGEAMCADVVNYVASQAKDVQIHTKNVHIKHIHTLPEVFAQLMRETIRNTDN